MNLSRAREKMKPITTASNAPDKMLETTDSDARAPG